MKPFKREPSHYVSSSQYSGYPMTVVTQWQWLCLLTPPITPSSIQRNAGQLSGFSGPGDICTGGLWKTVENMNKTSVYTEEGINSEAKFAIQWVWKSPCKVFRKDCIYINRSGISCIYTDGTGNRYPVKLRGRNKHLSESQPAVNQQ